MANKKIYGEGETCSFLYSESYEVHYKYTDPADGFWKEGVRLYRAAGKNAHRQVEARFRRDVSGMMHGLRIISIIYQ